MLLMTLELGMFNRSYGVMHSSYNIINGCMYLNKLKDIKNPQLYYMVVGYNAGCCRYW